MNIIRDPETIIGAWLDDGPAQLPSETRQAIVVGLRTLPRRRVRIHWPFSDGFVRPNRDRRPLALALATLVIVAVIGALVTSNLRPQPFAPAATLPTSPSDWSRVAINSDVGGGVDSVFATPLGLLAMVNQGDETGWYFSVDGLTWTMVPADQIPDLSNPAFATDSVSVAGNTERILMAGREVLASEDGINWSVVASPSQDPEIGQGAINAIASGGPGFVAVGIANKAWYSTDGSDWALAAVPTPPNQPPLLEAPLDSSQTQGTVEMEGVVRSGNHLLAWGKSIWVHTDGSATFVPVFWTSSDGFTWRSVPAPGGTQWDYPTVAGGPNGFIASGQSGAVWFSPDGSSWEHVAAAGAFGQSRWQLDGQDVPTTGDGVNVELLRMGIAAGPAGYVAAGTDGACALACSSEEAVIWTSPDGRSWTRLPDDPLFTGTSDPESAAGTESITAWGDRFVVGGGYNGQAAIWISSSTPSDNDNPPPAPTQTPTGSPSAMPVGETPRVTPTPLPSATPKPLAPRNGGEFIVFGSRGPGLGWNLAAKDPHTGDVRTLVDTNGLLDCQSPDSCTNFIRKAEYSADGRWVAFEVSNADLDEQRIGPCAPTLGLWVEGPDGIPTQLTTPCEAPPSTIEQPVRELWRWSPVDDRIAYVQVNTTIDELFVIDASSGERTSLITGTFDVPYPVESWSLAWSPDASRIVYVDGNSVYSVDASTGARSLLADSFQDVIDIGWSPDGTKLFVHDHGRDRISVMNPDGSDLHVVLEGADACCETAWSPNSDRILYMLSTGRRSEVWTVAADGSDPTMLYSGTCGDTLPVWSPDGAHVAYARCDGWVVQTADGSNDAQPFNQAVWRSWYGSGLTAMELVEIGAINH